MTDTATETYTCLDCGISTDLDGGGEDERNEFRCNECGELHESFTDDPTGTWMQRKKIYRVEGEKGLDTLNSLAEALGYKKHGFRYGSPLEVMLADNQHMMEALLAGMNEVIGRDENLEENLKQDL